MRKAFIEVGPFFAESVLTAPVAEVAGGIYEVIGGIKHVHVLRCFIAIKS
jgi:hypothetical protein